MTKDKAEEVAAVVEAPAVEEVQAVEAAPVAVQAIMSPFKKTGQAPLTGEERMMLQQVRAACSRYIKENIHPLYEMLNRDEAISIPDTPAEFHRYYQPVAMRDKEFIVKNGASFEVSFDLPNDLSQAELADIAKTISEGMDGLTTAKGEVRNDIESLIRKACSKLGYSLAEASPKELELYKAPTSADFDSRYESQCFKAEQDISQAIGTLIYAAKQKGREIRASKAILMQAKGHATAEAAGNLPSRDAYGLSAQVMA